MVFRDSDRFRKSVPDGDRPLRTSPLAHAAMDAVLLAHG
jgi:hypothetical protein